MSTSIPRKRASSTGSTSEPDEQKRVERPARTRSDQAGVSHSSVGQHRRAAESNYHQAFLYDFFEVVRSAEPDHAQTLLEMIRNHASLQEIRAYLDRILANTHASEENKEMLNRLERLVRQEIEDAESEEPRFRPKVMDIRYLCGSAPVKVPAKPWTTVTDDDDLVSHLVSLYTTWDYPFYAFFDRTTFVTHMARGNLNSDFCSPLLVNALLANACHYSQYSEAYAVPGDVRTKGADFLAEAERHMRTHQIETGKDARLASLQAFLLLYERYSMSGDDDLGYTMLHRAIDMAESFGIINHDTLRLRTSQMSEEMIVSIKRTAWGLFQVDTVVHTNFLKPSRVNSVSVVRIDRDETGPEEMWTPYPISNQPRQSHLSEYFDEACKLSYIARDISRNLSQALESGVDRYQSKQELYNRLRQWEKEQPPNFSPAEKPAPHIILLRMRYHTLVINICCEAFDANSDSRTPEESRPSTGYSAVETALASAREIAALTQLQRTEYGIEYAHQFAMYAINLALYTILGQPSFDILDPDFLNLVTAFSIIACRSPVGRELLHVFKHSIRSRNQGERVQHSEVPQEIKELFRQVTQSQAPGKRDSSPERLTRADEMSYPEGIGDDSQSSAASGLQDMLERYEKLSVGKEEERRGRQQDEQDDAFWDFEPLAPSG